MNIKVSVKTSCLMIKPNMCFFFVIFMQNSVSFNTNFGCLSKGESSQ